MPAEPHERIELPINTIIEKLKAGEDDTRGFAVLQGYVGEEKDGIVKIYPQLDLRTYFNVPTGDIVFAEVTASSPLSPTKLVIKSTAKIEVVKISVQSYEAGFLAGAIAAANLPGAQVQSRTGSETAATLSLSLDSCLILRKGPPPPPPPPRSVCSNPCITEAPL
jgi:hypothetical protein